MEGITDMWGELRKRQWVSILWFALFLPAMVITHMAIGEKYLFGVLLGWFVIQYLLMRHLGKWLCPRCGKPFVVKTLWRPLTSKCVHCGLRKGEKP